MPNNVTTLTRSSALLATNNGLRTFAIANEILDITPNRKIMTVLLSSLKRISEDSRKFTINTRSPDPAFVTVTNVNGTTITISAADIKSVEAGSMLRVNATVATYVVSITDRSAGTFVVGANTGMEVGTKLLLAGRVKEENSSAPTALSRSVEQVDQYQACLRDAWGESRWVQTEKHYGPTRHRENRRIAMEEHGNDCERNLLLSVSLGASVTLNSNPIYSGNGAVALCSSNVHEFDGGIISYKQMLDFGAQDGRYMKSPEVWMLCNATVIGRIINLAYNKGDIILGNETVFGINVTRLRIGSKVYRLYESDQFNGALANCALTIDPAAVSIATTRNQETGVLQWMIEETDARTPGLDGSLGVITTDLALRLDHELCIALWTNMTSSPEGA